MRPPDWSQLTSDSSIGHSKISDRHDWSKRLRVLIEPSNNIVRFGTCDHTCYRESVRHSSASYSSRAPSRVASDLDLALALVRAPDATSAS